MQRLLVASILGGVVVLVAGVDAGCGTTSSNQGSAEGGPMSDDGPEMVDGIAPVDGASEAGDSGTAEAEAGPPPPCHGPPANPDAWSTYGHDARRTSASSACIHTSFKELWRYPPPSPDGGFAGVPANEVADTTSLYVHMQLGTVPSADKVSAATGARTWRYHGGADFDNGNWLSVGLGYVMIQDDGVYQVDVGDGGLAHTSGVDWWGQTAADTSRFYVVDVTHGDGPGAFVGAWDQTKGQMAWKANQQGACQPAIGDENGGLAVDGTVLYFAPRYEVGAPQGGLEPADAGVTFMFPSGLYAFDAASGTKKWSVPSTPNSAISAGDGHVYGIEPGPALVARSETDGSIAWSAPIQAMAQAVSTSPPVQAAGLVIVATSDHVLAFDAMTGKAAWSTMVQGAGQHGYDQNTVDFLSCPQAQEPMASLAPTTLAAATSSNTLVVTGSMGIAVLSLTSGMQLGNYSLTGAFDPVLVGDRLYVLNYGTAGAVVVALQAQ
ncbi:MAG TPA: PQQ-binding-like beta-propeller repeat protein [Polyangiaceae bacterium]